MPAMLGGGGAMGACIRAAGISVRAAPGGVGALSPRASDRGVAIGDEAADARRSSRWRPRRGGRAGEDRLVDVACCGREPLANYSLGGRFRVSMGGRQPALSRRSLPASGGIPNAASCRDHILRTSVERRIPAEHRPFAGTPLWTGLMTSRCGRYWKIPFGSNRSVGVASHSGIRATLLPVTFHDSNLGLLFRKSQFFSSQFGSTTNRKLAKEGSVSQISVRFISGEGPIGHGQRGRKRGSG